MKWDDTAAFKSATPLLSAQHLVKEYGKPKKDAPAFRAVDDVSFEVYAGQTVSIVGESGSGKSTTARIAGRLIDATAGELSFKGVRVESMKGGLLKELRRQVQFVFQDPFSSLNPRHTAGQIITAPLRYLEVRRPEGARRYAQSLMDRVGLNPNHVDRFPYQFSGGQAQRIGIARALAVEPALVICDEAVSALDVTVQKQILDLLQDLQRERGISYVFIAHDLAVVHQISHRVIVMQGGKLVEQGTRDEVFDAPQTEYTTKLLSAIPHVGQQWKQDRRQR